MPKQFVTLFWFELIAVVRQPAKLLWLVFIVASLQIWAWAWFLQEDGAGASKVLGLFILLSASLSPFGHAPLRAPQKKWGSFIYPLSRNIGRLHEYSIKLGASVLLGGIVFGSMGIAAVSVSHPEPIHNSTIVVHQFATLRAFENAGLSLSFPDVQRRDAYLRWPATPFDEDKQQGSVDGLLSPALVAVALGFIFYLIYELANLMSIQKPMSYARRDFDPWALVGSVLFMTWLFGPLFATIYLPDIVTETIYLMPGVMLSCLAAAGVVFACLGIRRWRSMDL